ncbi:hypothetical protein EPUL_005935, partial [Erysiphe pulchra]
MFPQDVQDDAFTSVKNKVILKPEWRLIVANADVFKKLSNIQNALQIALIPYHLWAQRVAIEMSGDFSSVRIWSAGKRLSWIVFLEGIFTTMQRLNALHSPFTTFSLLTPKDTESAYAFAWRLRDTFYNLSGIDRQSDTTRDLLKEILMTHLPRVWTISSPQLINSDNHEIVELVVQVASQVAKWKIEDKLPNESSQTENLFNPPSLETPSFNSKENPKFSQPLSAVFPSAEDICYTCGRKGHWSKNCHASSTSNPKNTQLRKNSITKPINKYGELRRKLNLFRSSKKTSPTFKRKQHKTYLTNDDDINVNDEDIDPVTRLDDTNLEQDLDQLLEDNDQPLPDKPIREGFGRPHNLFLTRLYSTPHIKFHTFFDYGSSTCYISSSLAKELFPYDSVISTISGIGGNGPKIIQDVLIEAQFFTSNDKWSVKFSVSAGILPDGTFPGDLTLGHTIFHSLGLFCRLNGQIQLLKMPDNPILNPIPNISTSPHLTLTASENTKLFWHNTTTENGYKFGKIYAVEFPSLFNKSLRRVDKLSKVRHCIDTGNHNPIKLPPRRYSPNQLQAINDFCKTHEGSIIQKSQGPWAAPLVLIPKKANSQSKSTVWRVCVDYRELNKITKKHAHPLPNTYDEIQRAAGHKLYAFLDLENGFWHIRMHKNDREKTAFVTPYGIFEWLVMPFGLCNAPATFQNFMEEVLGPYRSFVAGLLDDVAVWGDTVEELHSRLLTILKRFVSYGLLLNTSKCRLFVTSGVFLGFVISEDGIAADPEKVAAIRDRPMPSTTSEIRGFIGAAGYLRSLIKNFSQLAGPLTDQSVGPKNKPVKLSAESINSWRTIKNVLTTTPLVKKFDWRLPIVLETDASQKFLGAVLLQPHLHFIDKQRSILHPIAYFSKKLNETQQRYSAQERELLCILLSLQHWRHWVEGGDVTVITDHQSLKTIQTKSEQPARIIRFLDTIEHYGIRILYRKGKANVLADYLSRPPQNASIETTNAFPVEKGERDENLLHQTDTESQLEQVKYPEQLNRIDLQCIFEFLKQEEDLPFNLNPDWVRKNFGIFDNTLHFIKMKKPKQIGDPPEPPGAIILFKVLEYEDLISTVKLLHENLGHASVGTTMREASLRYWHPELILAIYEVIRNCRSCQLMKPPDPSLGNLRPIQPAPPLTRWGMDHTQIGQKILLNAIEYATGWLESRIVPNANFENTVPLLLFIFHTFGKPKQIISDNAGCFSGNEAKRFQEKHNFTMAHTTPNRPQGNGKVEQANGILKGILARLILDNRDVPLKRSLMQAVTIYNRRISPSGFSPFFLLFGTQPSEIEMVYPAYSREATDAEEIEWANELAKLHAAPIARTYVNSLKATRAKTQAYLQESKALLRVYSPGDWVLRVRQRKHKFEPYYDGPWAIAACHANNTYSLISPGGYKLLNRYNGTNLFPAYVRDGHPVQSLWYGSRNMLNQD